MLLVLQNRWKQMTKLVKKDIKLKAVFEKLKDDIRNLSEELDFLKEQIKPTENSPPTTDKKYLRILKVKRRFFPFNVFLLLS